MSSDKYTYTDLDGDQRETLAQLIASLESLRDLIKGRVAGPPATCGSRRHVAGVTGDGIWVWCGLEPGHRHHHKADLSGVLLSWHGDNEPGLCGAEFRAGGLVTLSPLRRVRVSCSLPYGHVGLHEADMREHDEPLYRWNDEPGL